MTSSSDSTIHIKGGQAAEKTKVTVAMYGYTWITQKSWKYAKRGKKVYKTRKAAFKACKAADSCKGVTKLVSFRCYEHASLFRPTCVGNTNRE